MRKTLSLILVLSLCPLASAVTINGEFGSTAESARHSFRSSRRSEGRVLDGRGEVILLPTAVGAFGGSAFGLFMAMMGVGYAAVPVVGGLATLGGAAIGSLACTALQATRFGDTFAQRYINCMAEPLRYFDKNPRDRMYLQSVLKCDPAQIVVRLASPAGRIERREFNSDGTELTSVTLIDESSHDYPQPELVVSLQAGNTPQRFVAGRTELAHQTITTLSFWQLSGLQPLFDDYSAYQELCRSPEKLKALEAPRGFDAITLRQLHLDSR